MQAVEPYRVRDRVAALSGRVALRREPRGPDGRENRGRRSALYLLSALVVEGAGDFDRQVGVRLLSHDRRAVRPRWQSAAEPRDPRYPAHETLGAAHDSRDRC